MPRPNPRPNQRGNNRNDKNDRQKKKKPNHKMPDSMIKRGSKREVVFDPEARRDHLRGFSERKRQRRAFGLAMQKVKDRKAKIEQRASEKKDTIQRIEEAEQQKEQWMEEVVRMNNSALDSFSGRMDDSDEDNDKNKVKNRKSDGDNDDDNDSKKEKKQATDVIDTKVYDDQKTEKTWGGQVTVTTSVVELDDDSDGDDYNGNNNNDRSAKSIDKAQRYAGDVQRYMTELKGNMPAKKNRDKTNTKRKGMNGAADMKGVGGSGHLKIASKLLHKSKDRSLASSAGGKKGKKGRKR